MLFNSVNFLAFFPIVALLYFALPHKVRWMWLLAGSYYFYMSWNPRYALLLAASTVITFLSGLLIDRSNQIQDEKKRFFQRRLWVALSFSSNLAILFFFKYFDFAVDNINRVLQGIGMEVLNPSFDVLLPVGISFYTFQALSYTIDIYRGEIQVEKNLAKYALFVSFFPQLVAGPIERSKNLLVQISERHYFDYDCVKNGLLLMLWGYFQKVVIADRAAVVVGMVYENPVDYTGFQIVIATGLFAFQIYCDFAGYSNIAKGAAQVMGFRLMDNFNQPYFAISVQDFWRRWHISLSSWFRDYLYIPLGGSRCSRLRKYRNIMITFLASGLWHGANWTFVIWGGLHGLYQIFGDLIRSCKAGLFPKQKAGEESVSERDAGFAPSPEQKVSSKPFVRLWACIMRALAQTTSIICTFILVDFAWIFFRAPGLSEAVQMIRTIFLDFGWDGVFSKSTYKMGLGGMELLTLSISIVILLLADLLQTKTNVRMRLARQKLIFRWAAYYALVLFILIYGAFGEGTAQTEFIYFQF